MKPSKVDIIKFLAVMIVFLIGMVIMLINKIDNTWLWIGYITVWWWAELVIAKNFHLKLWGWVLILAVILIIDALVIFFFG
ncbi:hypothetical protein GWK08_15590 [Leptobacterium flavescens]|uniref:Phosphatidate cytidylyltransferase n=1 Tax=Leptobacterium flavescens TaxID=472055 RepID=A0A6P0UST2_9FLAO|nr:hypothetical protein [Leptobacterium flavescens]NER14879.1 hypothetical protein [Leptobacterium flavescens]